jgi:hypothetical protein
MLGTVDPALPVADVHDTLSQAPAGDPTEPLA